MKTLKLIFLFNTFILLILKNQLKLKMQNYIKFFDE